MGEIVNRVYVWWLERRLLAQLREVEQLIWKANSHSRRIASMQL